MGSPGSWEVHEKAARLAHEPAGQPTSPLGTLSVLPAEIRRQIWQEVLWNPDYEVHEDQTRKSFRTMDFLLLSKAIYQEAIGELYHKLELVFTLDAARILKASVSDGHGGQLRRMDMGTHIPDTAHPVWKIPAKKIDSIAIRLDAAKTQDSGAEANLFMMADHLIDHLTAIYTNLPAMKIKFHLNPAADTWSLWKTERMIHHNTMTLALFTRLRKCKSVQLSVEESGSEVRPGFPAVGGAVLHRIARTIEHRAISTARYGSDKHQDSHTATSSVLIRTSVQSSEWDYGRLISTANDHITEQFLNVCRNHFDEIIDNYASEMAVYLRRERFARWTPAYEAHCYKRLIGGQNRGGGDDDDEFGSLEDCLSAVIPLAEFETRYKLMRAFHPYTFRGVVVEKCMAGVELNRFETTALGAVLCGSRGLAWRSAYAGGFPSLHTLLDSYPHVFQEWDCEIDLRADGVHEI